MTRIPIEGNGNVQDITLDHNINSNSHNVVQNVPQRSTIHDVSITNNLYQSIEGCFAQQPRLPLSPVTVEGNESVILPSGQKFEHASIEKLETTRSHETIERTTFHEQMDRNAPKILHMHKLQ